MKYRHTENIRTKTAFFRNPLRCCLLVPFLLTTVLHAQYNFSPSNLNGASLNNPTSIQFGPDGRLYVGQLNGLIQVLTIKRNAGNNYAVTASEIIYLIDYIPNHNDNGTVTTTVPTRQITSILVKGTAAQPLIYVTSSDSRMGGPAGDLNLDTNSGILSLITKNGSVWQKIDLVRGLPRSEENHSPNGMQMNDVANMLYMAIGGFTNAGAPSTNFAYSCERALSGAILSFDLNAIMAMPTKGTGNNAYKYDLPTLDDPTRSNNADGTDVNDPFGGNNGLNQAKLVKGGPVQIFSAGYRNNFDLLITKTPGKAGRIYTIDNGANPGWGGYPDKEGTNGTVTNNYVPGEPGSAGPSANHPIVNNLDNLHYIGNIATYRPGSFYGGHPNPVRANPAGAGLYTYNNGTTGVFRTSKTGANPLPADWPPVPLDMADPRQGQFLMPGVQDSALLTFLPSTNGLAEYTASNFNNSLKGNILAACLTSGEIFRIIPTADGKDVLNAKSPADKQNKDLPFASGFGTQPLDIIAQGDNDPFAGTVWVANYGSENITILEPQDFVTCTGKYNTLDDDQDGYTNADEVDNGTQPCSASSTPPDFDKDRISDLNDPDDDNDGILDTVDYFPIDAGNGSQTTLPVNYNFYNNNTQEGFFGLGFTGLMCNKKPDNNYLKLFSQDSLIAGGAVGAFTLTAVSKGDALGNLNNQGNAFQFGVKLDAKTSPFTVYSRMLGPFFNGKTPVNFQSQGMFIGTGDQSNYLKIAVNANGGAGGIEVLVENADAPLAYQFALPGGINRSTIDLYLGVDPIAGTIQPRYSADGGSILSLGSSIAVSGALLDAIQGKTPLAAGIISTSRGATPFIATWDFIQLTYNSVTANGTWQTITPSSGGFIPREDNAFADAGDKFYLMGGRGISPVQAYDPATKGWTNGAQPPVELNHFQALTIGGLVYAPAAFTGAYPHETPVPVMYIYDPVRNSWLSGSTIPAARRRGSAGAVSYKNKIYLVGGIKDGHYAGWVKWFDEYDPVTNTWKTLPDAPRTRDHFHAAVINDKLYVAGGRRSSESTGEPWNLTVPEVDIYDFSTGQWTTLPAGSNIPTPRGSAATQVLGNELILMGGESARSTVHAETEALNVQTNTWRKLANMQQGRRGSQAVKSNNGIYIASGSGSKKNDSLRSSMEAFYLYAPTLPNGVAVTQSTLTATLDSAFKIIPAGMESNRTIILANQGGTQDILVSDIDLRGAADFTESPPYPLPFVIPAGGSAVVNIKFKPLTAGLKSASLVVIHSGKGDSISTALSVNIGNNQAPLASAGIDTVLTLPANSFVLKGSGVDFDGVVTGYTWSQVSGPNAAGFSSLSVAKPTVSGLVAGSYVFSLTVTDNNNTPSQADQVVITVTKALPATGLNYRYYEGSWTALPNFSALIPIKTGSSPNVDLTVKNRPDNFGIVWEGNIYIPGPGTYTFESVSDDGSRIYFNSLYSPTATPLLNHDGVHWAYSASASVNVPAKGVYPIAITYFDKDGGEFIQLYWSGPGIPRQPIPNGAFSSAAPQADTSAPSAPANLKMVSAGRTTITLHWDASTDNVAVTAYDIYRNGVKKYTSTTNDFTPDSLLPSTAYVFSIRARDLSGNTSAASANLTASTTSSGLTYRYYEGNWNALPNFNLLPVVKTGASANIDLNIKNRADSFGIVWEGNITIPVAGTYTFEVASDDGSKLYFNSLYSPSATPLVSHDGVHWASSVQATINIPAAGSYPFALAYFEKDGGESVQVYWTGPGISRQLIPNTAFGGSPSALQHANSTVMGTVAGEQSDTQPPVVRVYPNPFATTFVTAIYNPAAGNSVEVELYDFTGKLLYTHHAGTLPAGSTAIKVDPGRRYLAPGVYIVRVMVNGVAARRVKLVKEK